MFLFKPKKPDLSKTEENLKKSVDLEIITKMNQEFALSLDLNETLMTALKVIIKRINAQAANIFLINEKINKFECIASLNQDYYPNVVGMHIREALQLLKLSGHDVIIKGDFGNVIKQYPRPETPIKKDLAITLFI